MKSTEQVSYSLDMVDENTSVQIHFVKQKFAGLLKYNVQSNIFIARTCEIEIYSI